MEGEVWKKSGSDFESYPSGDTRVEVHEGLGAQSFYQGLVT